MKLKNRPDVSNVLDCFTSKNVKYKESIQNWKIDISEESGYINVLIRYSGLVKVTWQVSRTHGGIIHE